MEDKLRAAIEQARIARPMWEDVLGPIFSEIESNYSAAWRATAPRDVQTREKLWLAVTVIGKVREHFARFVNDGKLAQADLNMRMRKNG